MNHINLADQMLQRILDAEKAWSPAELLRQMAVETGASRRMLQDTLASLVAAGDLAYLVRHGQTCIQRGWHKPLPVGKKTQLLAPGLSSLPGRESVILLPGASFGGGDHPTTRLCLEAIEICVKENGTMLDVGTGTGVLAIAAVRHGAKKALAVDNDPLAVHEAKENVRLNGLEDAVQVEEVWPLGCSWDLVAANLRPPTLMELAEALSGSLSSGGFLVLSGMRKEEMPLLIQTYGRLLETVCSKEEKGWGSLIFIKTQDRPRSPFPKGLDLPSGWCCV
ncbi:ribosomal protein L11 methyltransferase [Desulfobotulus alkaliphilus]|uniref:Ribosomal protein L11 methyltransferase n=1 Tax=Desulfobotulus alkaliphilus TaxID=622671 RepID=A0A562S2I5_9BACT|nr:50S ribosomal protein L11 methyltransferase [Desulfobotulus alkaliphilus]TWI75601.1 ribosomal protein L11 methyltransferase [Desulfobotulus alkaliphilus]